VTAASSKEASVSGGQAGRWAAALDASLGWRGESGTGATVHEAATAFGCFRFFDGDMHFTRPTLFRLVRAFQKATTHDRTKFYTSTVAVRRRLERKWHETPLAAVFSIDDEWLLFKQRSQAAFVREALRSRGVTSWEAFVAVDADGNAQLAPSELYGFLRWLGVPDLTPDDVVDFFELADKSRDGMIDYHEYMSLFDDENCGGQVEQDESEMAACKESIPKIEPFGADELREIMVERRRQALDRQRMEQARQAAEQAVEDLRTYRWVMMLYLTSSGPMIR